MIRRLILASTILAGAIGARADDSAGAPTYVKDVAPILMANCAECHRKGQIAPMGLLNFEEVRPWAKSIRKAVSEKTMPPWFADPKYGKFRDAMVLKESEIETIVRWVEGGAPRGEGAEPPAPEFAKTEWRMEGIDQVFEVPTAFTLPDSLEDQYHNFVIPTNLKEDKWVIGTELLPSAPDVVHHILVFIAPPGAAPSTMGEGGEGAEAAPAGAGQGVRGRRFGGGGGFGGGVGSILAGGGSGLFAKFGPGTNPEVWPDGRGRLLPAGSSLVLQVHYHKEPGPGTSKTDRSRIALKYAKGPVEHPITSAWIADPTFHIPAGDPNYQSISVFKFEDDGHIYGMTPHLHMRGKDFRYEAVYPDGKTEILLDVPKYDFSWQISYIFEEPKSIPSGTKIRAIAHWDNSPGNPRNPDATKNVSWGQPSTAEMMIGFMDYTYNTKKNEQAQYGLPEGKEELMKKFMGRRGGAGAGFANITVDDLIKGFDTNGDGLVQSTELPGMLSNFFGTADINKDGALDKTEAQGVLDLVKQFRGGAAGGNRRGLNRRGAGASSGTSGE